MKSEYVTLEIEILTINLENGFANSGMNENLESQEGEW